MLIYKSFFIFLSALAFSQPSYAKEVKHLVDAEADVGYRHNFVPATDKHGSRVLIDRFHKTIYQNEESSTGAQVMLEIMDRDGFSTTYADNEIDSAQLGNADVLIIHGLPNNSTELDNGGVFWKSPLSIAELEAIVRWVDGGGGLFVSLSHFPGGSGALPLLEAFEVKFRDGYIYSSEYPSFVDPKNGRCSHYFGMSRVDNTLNAAHPLIKDGLTVEKIDYHCGAAIFRKTEDAVLKFPAESKNFNQDNSINETSDFYAGMIGFEFGKGKVVIAADQGMFRNFIFTFDTEETVYVTITGPDNDNANLFVNMIRWLSPKTELQK